MYPATLRDSACLMSLLVSLRRLASKFKGQPARIRLQTRAASQNIRFAPLRLAGLKLAGLLPGLLVFFFAAFIMTSHAYGQESRDYTKPMQDGLTHEGVMTCYGSTCHSRQLPVGTTVRQNELVTWQDRSAPSGAHSRAYKVLLNQRSRAIARNLGIGPAEKAPECLACHTDFVPANHRGEKYDITEGVTCESCHGGAEKWLTAHYAPGRTHAQNIADGMYPTDDPKARASLCLTCHFGSDADYQFVDHRIMGAGHPRISFELDLFTTLQKHHDVDADYLQRKPKAANGVKTWAIGQSMTIAHTLDLFLNPKTGKEGIFPELVFYDCHACHQTISNDPDWQPQWRANPGRPLGPGEPIFNDANMIMLKAALSVTDPIARQSFDTQLRRFHSAMSQNESATRNAARELRDEALIMTDKLVMTNFTKGQADRIFRTILNDTLSREYTQYAAAEQAVIAVDTFLNAMVAENWLDLETALAMRPAINNAYAAVETPNSYNLSRLQTALREIQAFYRRSQG